jgi:hypothetical protein
MWQLGTHCLNMATCDFFFILQNINFFIPKKPLYNSHWVLFCCHKHYGKAEQGKTKQQKGKKTSPCHFEKVLVINQWDMSLCVPCTRYYLLNG